MKKYLIDLGERVGATFLFTFLSTLSFTDLSTARDAGIAGAAAAASILKGAIARYIGDPDSASLLK